MARSPVVGGARRADVVVRRLRRWIATRLQDILRPLILESVSVSVESEIAKTLLPAVTNAFGRTVDVQWRRYLALAQLAARATPLANLAQAECRVFSQNGEDGVLHELFRRLAVEPFFVEFGAGRGSEGNAVLLAEVAGWPGVFLEADADDAAALAAKYRANEAVASKCVMVTPDNVEDVFAEMNVPLEPALVSIDVDGADYWIWKRIERYRPAVVVIEYNGTLPVDGQEVFPYDPMRSWTGNADFGASVGALVALGAAKGYSLVHTDLTGVNAFFLRTDLVGDLPHGDAVVRRPANYLFQGRGFNPGGAQPVTLD